MENLKSLSEFEVMDGIILKHFMAENLVLNYSNIKLDNVLFPSSNKKSG